MVLSHRWHQRRIHFDAVARQIDRGAVEAGRQRPVGDGRHRGHGGQVDVVAQRGPHDGYDRVGLRLRRKRLWRGIGSLNRTATPESYEHSFYFPLNPSSKSKFIGANN